MFFFLKNSLFCLSEPSWALDKKKFIENYFRSCFDREFYFKRNGGNIFITSIIDYFKLETGVIIHNIADISKVSSKGKAEELNDTDNNYFYIEKASHFRY